jgi:energy-coupling factor transporter ATP-binding protein EcfA2
VRLVLDWKKKLGYTKDPFEPNVPTPVQQFLVGANALQEKCNLFLIKGQRYGTIQGERGSGKTMFLHWIAQAVGAHRGYRAILIDGAESSRSADLLRALGSGASGFFARTLGARIGKGAVPTIESVLAQLGKGTSVILVDNAGSLHKDAIEILNTILERTSAHIIAADTPERIRRLDIAHKDDLGIAMPSYGKAELVELLRRRIASAGGAGTFPFEDEHLDLLVRKADGSPVRLLQLSRERAIELSLKASAPPRAAAAPVAQGDESAKRKFLSIRIDRGARKDESAPPLIEEHEERATEQPSPSAEHHEDAKMLMEIVEQAERQPEPRPSSASHDDLVKSIAKDFGAAPKRHAAKKKAKRR